MCPRARYQTPSSATHSRSAPVVAAAPAAVDATTSARLSSQQARLALQTTARAAAADFDVQVLVDDIAAAARKAAMVSALCS